MRAINALLALGLAASLQSAHAGAVLLDFDDISTGAVAAADRYASKGVHFSSNAYVLSNEYSWTRTGGTNRGALFLGATPGQTSVADSVFTIDVAGGFLGAVEFSYSTQQPSADVFVSVFDGLNGKGKLIESLTYFGTSTCVAGKAWCNWLDRSVTFGGLAKSVTFTSIDGVALFDDIRLTTPAVSRVPEPMSLSLTLVALLGVGAAMRRRSA
jgi:hypothetical protein